MVLVQIGYINRILTRNLIFAPQNLNSFSINFSGNMSSNLNINKKDSSSNTLLKVIEKKINQMEDLKRIFPKRDK